MKTKLHATLAFILFILICQNTSVEAQQRIAVYGMQNKGGTSSINVVPEKIINYFSNDKDFAIIDRKNKQLVNKEMRMQKSEDFIDGYIVEQGKAEGADIICQSIYDHKSKRLIIQMTDVATKEIMCSKERKLDSGWLKGLKNLDQELTIMLFEISSDCFGKGFPVVRAFEKSKNKVKKLLVLAGYAQRIKLKYKMEIVMSVEEKIGDITKIRKTAIGKGYISQIEDENFSILKVEDGKKEIFQALEDGIKLECRLINEKK